MPQLPSGTVTFLFTDIEGSTQLLRDVGQESFALLLADHDRLIRAAIAESGGVEVRTEGDAFFIVFTTVPAAIEAVVAAQRSLQGHKWQAGSQVRVRMGLHTGTGILGGDDYVGIDVHRAARVADAGHGGQVLLSDTTASIAASHLPAGIDIEYLGEHSLKDFAESHVHQLVVAGLESEFPPLRAPRARATNLPTHLSSFVGRKREVADVVETLDDKRLVTLTGPGGTGKTRLSIRVASELAASFRDGAVFVPLAGISDPDLVTNAILESLDLRSTSAENAPIEQLNSFLAGREILLILDNFEQVVAASPVVSGILRHAPQVKAIVTSRIPLRIEGEQEMPVPPLSTSSEDQSGDSSPSESAELFIERAHAIRPDLDFTGANAQSVTQLTARLDGLPLAIELAASRVNVLTPSGILDRLDNRLLANPSADLPSRQQTIVNTIGWSYDLLEKPARLLFERCSLFVTPATFEEIEKVCGSSGDSIDVLDELGILVDHSLMRRTEAAGESRFGMLLVIREFAYAALVARGDEAEAAERHAAAYRELVESAEPNLLTSARAVWLARLALDHDNIRAALDWAVGAGDAKTALSISAGMWRYWQTRGPLPEAMERVAEALALPADEPRMRAKALEAAGGIAYWKGDLEAMDAPYSEAVALVREHGDPAQLAYALYNASFAHSATGHFDKSREAIDESQAISEEIGDTHGLARADWARFYLAWYVGYQDESLRYALLAVEGFEKLDAAFDFGWACFAVGDSYRKLGDLDAAGNYFDRALPSFLEAGDISALILFLSTYAAIAVMRGNRPRGARLMGAATAMKEQTGITLFDSEAWDDPNLDVRDLLGEIDRGLALELDEGRRMTAEEAVAYAMQKEDTS